jgi:hypothetical protein
MRDRTKWLSNTTGCLVVAAVWAMLAVPSSTLAKKGGNGGGNTNIRLARIYFLDSPRIKGDGMECPDQDGVIWHYWDSRDPDFVSDPECVGCRIDVSGGGRVFFFTATQRPRWLTLDLTPTADDPAPFNEPPFDENGLGTGLDIDSVYDETIDGLPIDPNTFVDNVKGTISLPNMFKKTASRQAFDLTIRRFNPETGGWPPAGWSLHSIDDLYIEETSDPNVRRLTTKNPQTGKHDARWFELWQSGETAGSYTTVGIYSMRMTWEMRIIPAP